MNTDRSGCPDPGKAGRARAVSTAAVAGIAAGCALALAALPEANAQPGATYPVKPVTLVLPFAPGGTIDIQGRLLASGLSARLGQPFMPRNMPGATGAIATEYVARSAPDGYTLLFGSSAQTTSVPMVDKVNYRLEDLAPVSASGRGAMILAIHSQVPAKTLKEFVDHARSMPGKLNFGSPGEGSVGHLVAALFVARAGLNMVHVPYKGGGPAMVDLLGGQIPMLFGNSGEVMANAKSDRIRIIAVSTAQRMRQLPNIPTVAELLPGFEMTAWQGTLAPARTPRAIIDTLSTAIQALSKEPAVIERLEQFGVESTTTTPEQMAAIIRAEQPVYAEAVKAAGLGR
ncbi:MAG: Bug family tripartite tricarboxylate transporter substrate binding protein [bacterium]|nr:tripartite tricarboxylate transporter substrate binding protein [Betaproteobacteria bacterium]